MSQQEIVNMVHELDELGVIVQRESDEQLEAAIEELEICEGD